MSLITSAPHPSRVALDLHLTPAQRDALWGMSRQQRVAAMWARELTLGQLLEWSGRCPHEVPQLSGEHAWIVMQTADYNGDDEHPGGTR